MDERIKELLKYFEEYMLDTRDASTGLLGAAKAMYPMMVVSLGKETGDGLGVQLKRQLLKVWPPYRESILFLTAEGEAEDLQFSMTESGQDMSLDEVQERVSELFEESNYFQNYNRLLVFYLLDTTVHKGETDLKAYLDRIAACGEVISFGWQSSILFLTLNERIGNEEQAARIRNEYARLYFQTEEARAVVPCTYLISNKNTTGSFMPKQGNYFDRIFTDIILLCNSHDAYVSANMTHGALKTVGYTTQGKPVDDIAKASVSSLLKKIGDLQDARKADERLFAAENAEKTLRRLGIQKDGTFYLLEPYIQAASRFFPRQEEIDAFPRKTCDDLDLYSLSVREVEDETFGAWGCYIESIVSRVEQEIISGLQQEESFQDTYTRYLQTEFSRNELIWMAKNPEELRGLLEQEPVFSGSGNVIDSLKKELAARVFQNSGIRELIVGTIIQAGERAGEFLKMWDELVSTESILVGQGDLVPFYDQKVQKYIDRNAERIAGDFQMISTVQELKEFLYGEIRSLIKSDPIFRAPFEKELLERANQKDAVQALKAIADHLCGSNVRIWLAANGASLDGPVQMALLLQDESDLYPLLHETMPADQYYYYDTDINDSADALNVYALTETQLVV